MDSKPILIVYGTQYGQTEKIADRIAERLRARGREVTVLCGDELPLRLDLAEFDGVIVGASMIVGRHQRYVERFVREHLGELARMRTAFFSVSNSAAGDETSREQAAAVVARLLDRLAWSPTQTALFGGALAYTQYGAFTRWIMKSIARRAGGPTDTSRDWELTDWGAVESFAAAFADLVAESRVAIAS